jgi:hypothetical protein
LRQAVRAGAVEAAEEIHLDAPAAGPVVVEARARDVEPEARVADVDATQRALRADHGEFRVLAVAVGERLVLAEGGRVDEAVERDAHAGRRGERRRFLLRLGRRRRRRRLHHHRRRFALRPDLLHQCLDLVLEFADALFQRILALGTRRRDRGQGERAGERERAHAQAAT